MQHQEKIIQILSLLDKDQRPSTVRQYIEYVLFSLGGEDTIKSIIEFTSLEFDLNLQKEEIEDEIKYLLNEKRIVQIGEKFKLTIETEQ